MSVEFGVSVHDEIETELKPASQSRTWRDRWEQIQRECDEISKPMLAPLGSAQVVAARDRLHAFFVSCYHLKDALKVEAPNGITGQAVESAINADRTLSLVADLANLDKHATLTKPPRSGALPRVTSVSAVSAKALGGSRLKVDIEHRNEVHDGLEVALKAVEAWRRALLGWNLI